LTKALKIYNGEKTASSTNVEKSGYLPQSSCSRGSDSGLGCSSGEQQHELRVVLGSKGVVYFLKRVFKQHRKAERSTWQSPYFP
jgi:hypothetical protein